MVYVLHSHPRKINGNIDGLIFTDGIAATRHQNIAYEQRRKHGYGLSVISDSEFYNLLTNRGSEFKHKFRMSHEN